VGKGTWVGIGVLFASALLPQPGWPSADEPLLQGSLTLAREGGVIGTEDFRLLEAEGWYWLVSEGSLASPSGAVRWSTRSRFSIDDLTPLEYELVKTTSTDTLAVKARWSEQQQAWEVEISEPGKHLDTMAFRGRGWVLLDRDVVSQYLILGLKLWRFGGGEFTALVPQARIAVPLSAEAAGLVAFRAPWGDEVAQLWRLSLGGATVFLCEHGGEFLWAEVPGVGLSAWRSDLFPEPPRPYRVQQEATLPPGAREEEVRLPSGGVELAGTFLLPAGEGPFPALLFLPGTGEVDRNGSAPEKPAAIFRELAHSLARAGFASLRYDKRGVGGSGGDLSRASLSELISDAGAALSWLGSRPEVKGVFVVGHSEGTFHALALAGEVGVAGLVLLGASARPLREVLPWQLETALRAAGAPEERIAAELRALREFLAFAAGSSGDWEDYTPAELRAALPGYAPRRLEEMRKTSLRWWREALAFDPVAAVGEVRVPLLALNGGADIRVPPEDALLLAEAARAAGNPEAYGLVIPKANHWLRFQPGRPVPEIITGPLDPRAVQALISWIEVHSGR